ncbi:TPA: hypothetical protein U5Y75_002108 [Streptococcus agalactiae]|nr:hypothetical protein [Enterococcus faecalis]EMF0599222.1 hypothetical protein [Enterococcus faecium]MBS0751461.1 hypothetical protein [Streptococcus suis]MBU5364384.1 hypothetical protein [Enterococcus devriesei]MBW7798862.1 hypothetical protein [Streptococcus thermophilus]MCA2382354.1 hypothetical protein [Lactococcus sp. SK2-659]MCA2391304.1 hypothetical protein [Lactococcus sp. NH2-7C]MCA6746618.1 hypothetical protein [Enterococcus lactis]MCB6853016.1 hypothetical protein [Lactococcus
MYHWDFFCFLSF